MNYTFALLLFFPFALLAQQNTTSPFSIGIAFSPEVTWLQGEVGFEENLQLDDTKAGFSAQLNVGYALSDLLTLQSGIGFGKRFYDYEINGLTSWVPVDPFFGELGETRVEADISISEIQVPLMIRISPGNRWFIGSGVELAFQSEQNSQRTILVNDQIVEEVDPFAPQTNVAAVLGIGVQVPLSDQLLLSAEPQFRYYLRDYIFDNTNLASIGLKSSLSIGW